MFPMEHLKTAASEFVDNSPSYCPEGTALPVCRDKRGSRVDQFRLCLHLSYLVNPEALVLFTLLCKNILLK